MHREQSHWEQIYIGPAKFHIWEKPTLFCLTHCFLVKTTKINANIETKMISRKASCIMECGPSHLLKWKKKKTLKCLNYTLKAILLEKAPLGNPDCHLVHIGCADLTVFNSSFCSQYWTSHTGPSVCYRDLYHWAYLQPQSVTFIYFYSSTLYPGLSLTPVSPTPQSPPQVYFKAH